MLLGMCACEPTMVNHVFCCVCCCSCVVQSGDVSKRRSMFSAWFDEHINAFDGLKADAIVKVREEVSNMIA